MIEPRVRRASATPEERAARRAGSALPTRARHTIEDKDLLEDVPSRLPTSARRYDLPTPTREYMIPLVSGKTLCVTEQRLLTMGKTYQVAAQEVAPGTIAQKQRRKPHPRLNNAQPPDIIYGQPPAQDLPSADDPSTRGERGRGVLARALVVLGIGLLIMLVGWIGLSALGNWWQITQDDWHYGRPRTFQIDWNVGHGTSQNPISHFLAMNLDKKIEIIEIPGNDPAKSEIYLGPTLIGEGEDLTPVTLSFEEGNHPGHPDLIVHIAESRIIFRNVQVNGTWKFVLAPNQQ